MHKTMTPFTDMRTSREYHTILPHGKANPSRWVSCLTRLSLLSSRRTGFGVRLGLTEPTTSGDSVAAGASKANEWSVDSLRIWSTPNIVRTGAPSRKSTSVGRAVIFTLCESSPCAKRLDFLWIAEVGLEHAHAGLRVEPRERRLDQLAGRSSLRQVRQRPARTADGMADD